VARIWRAGHGHGQGSDRIGALRPPAWDAGRGLHLLDQQLHLHRYAAGTLRADARRVEARGELSGIVA